MCSSMPSPKKCVVHQLKEISAWYSSVVKPRSGPWNWHLQLVSSTSARDTRSQNNDETVWSVIICVLCE